MSDEFKVQRGITDYGASSDFVTPTLGSSVSALSAAWHRITNVRFSDAGPAAGGAGDLDNVDVGQTSDLFNTSRLAFQRYAGAENVDHRVHWELVEYIGAASGPNEFIVRSSAEHTLADGTTDHTSGASPGIVDWTRCIALVTGVRNDRSTMAWDSSAATVEVQSDKTLRIRRGNGTGELVVSVVVVEFTGSAWQVERFSQAITSAGSRVAATLSGSIPSWEKAFIVSSLRVPSGETADDETGCLALPGSADDEVDLYLAAGADNVAGGGYVAAGYAVYNPDLTVLHDNSVDGGLTAMASGDTTETATIPAEELDETSVIVHATAAGASPAYPRPHVGYRLSGTTSVELWRSRSGSAVDWSLQVVAFRRTSDPDATAVQVGIPDPVLDLPRDQHPDAVAVQVMAPPVTVSITQNPDATGVEVGVPIVPQVDNGGPIENLAYNPLVASVPVGSSITPMLPSYTGADATLYECLPSVWSSHRAPKLADVDPALADFEVQGPGVTGTGKGAVIRLSDGAVFSDLDYPTVEATKMAFPGAVIRINSPGQVPDGSQGLQFGGGDAGFKKYRADWVGTPYEGTPIDVTFVGANAGRADFFQAHTHSDNIDGVPSGGVDGIRFENLTLRATQFTKAVVESPLGNYNGIARYIRCNFIGGGFGAFGEFGGSGMQFGIRSQGLMRWDVRYCHFGALQDGTQPPGSLDNPGIGEHCIYVDGPQGDCYVVGCTMEGSTRTMIQVVNRKFEQDAAGGQSGFGIFLIEDCHAYNIWGAGGGAFSCYGLLGTFIVRDCTVTEGPDNVANEISYAALVVSPDIGKGVYENENGFALDRVVVENLTAVLPHSDRDICNVAGTEEVEILKRPSGEAFDLTNVNGRYAWDFNGLQEQGDVYPNGVVRFRLPDPVSSYAGFPPPTGIPAIAKKAKWNDEPMSDAELDALQADPETLPAGLALDSLAGDITGTPTEAFDPALRYIRAENGQGWDSFAAGFWITDPTGPTSQSPPATPVVVGVPEVTVDGASGGGPTEENPDATAVSVGVPAVSVTYEQQSSTVLVQRGVVDYGAAADLAVVDLPLGAVGALGRAVPRVTSTRHGDAGRVTPAADELGNADLGQTTVLPWEGQIAFQRFAAGEDVDHRLFWELLEWIGPAGHADELVVHDSGEVAFADGQTEVTVGPYAVIGDPARTIALVSGARSIRTAAAHSSSAFTAEVLVDRRITIRRGDSTGDARVSIVLIELVGAGWQVERVTHELAADGVWEPVSLGSAVPRWSQAMIVGSARAPAGQDDDNETGVLVRPAAALDQVEVRVGAGADAVAGGGYVWEGWVLANRDLTVTHDDSLDGGLAQMGLQQTELEHILPTEVDPLATIVLVSSTAAGNAPAYPRPHVGYRLKSSVRVELRRGRAGSRSHWTMQLVEFRREVFPDVTGVQVGVPGPASIDLPTEQAPEATGVTVGVPAPALDLPTDQSPAATAVEVGVPGPASIDLPTEQAPEATAIAVGVPAPAVDVPTEQTPAATGVEVGVPPATVDVPTEQAPDAVGVEVGVPDVEVLVAGEQFPEATAVTVGVPAVSVSYPTSQAPEATAVAVGVPAPSVDLPTEQAPEATGVEVGVPAPDVDLPTEQAPEATAVEVGVGAVTVSLPDEQAPEATAVVVGVGEVTVELPTEQAPDAVAVEVGVPEPSLDVSSEQTPEATAVIVGVGEVTVTDDRTEQTPEATPVVVGVPNPVLELGVGLDVYLELDVLPNVYFELDL